MEPLPSCLPWRRVLSTPEQLQDLHSFRTSCCWGQSAILLTTIHANILSDRRQRASSYVGRGSEGC